MTTDHVDNLIVHMTVNIARPSLDPFDGSARKSLSLYAMTLRISPGHRVPTLARPHVLQRLDRGTFLSATHFESLPIHTVIGLRGPTRCDQTPSQNRSRFKSGLNVNQTEASVCNLPMRRHGPQKSNTVSGV